MNADLGSVVEAIESGYGSLADPNYDFVSRAMRERPYGAIATALSRIVSVQETTDVNDDVSFRYHLERRSESWELALSMVGRLGLLIQLTPALTVVSQKPSRGRGRRIVELLETEQIPLVSQRVAEAHVPLRLPGELHDVTVYEALVGDEHGLPWQP